MSSVDVFNTVGSHGARDPVQALRSREANKFEKKADLPQSTEEQSTNGEMPVVQVLL